MIPLLAAFAWILVVATVTCLCAAARDGDRAQLGRVVADRQLTGERSTGPLEEQLEISARASLPATGSRSRLLDREGVAA